MGILAQRTIEYLTENQYIDKSIQKGFMEKISGCVEHTEALSEMLQDAKKNGNPIVTTWLDLQNAYGRFQANMDMGRKWKNAYISTTTTYNLANLVSNERG